MITGEQKPLEEIQGGNSSITWRCQKGVGVRMWDLRHCLLCRRVKRGTNIIFLLKDVIKIK